MNKQQHAQRKSGALKFDPPLPPGLEPFWNPPTVNCAVTTIVSAQLRALYGGGGDGGGGGGGYAVPPLWLIRGSFVYAVALELVLVPPQVNGMDWNGMEWIEMEWNRMEWNGMEWNGIEQPRVSPPPFSTWHFDVWRLLALRCVASKPTLPPWAEDCSACVSRVAVTRRHRSGKDVPEDAVACWALHARAPHLPGHPKCERILAASPDSR